MDKNELIDKLKPMKLPKNSYSIDSIEDESLCLISENKIWNIFYSEKGQRTEQEIFMEEEDACESFMKRLMHMVNYK